MRARIDKNITQPFVFSSDDAKRLYNLLGSDVKLQAKCNDGVTRQFESIDELLKYENEASKKIVNLKFRLYRCDNGDEFMCGVEFCSERNEPYKSIGEINLHISGREEKVMNLHDKINAKVNTYKPWYSFVARLGPTYAFFSSIAILLFIILEGFRVYSEEEFANLLAMKINQVSDFMTILYLFLFCSFFVILPVAWSLSGMIMSFKHWIFSSSTFAIGYQAKVEESRDKWRRTILIFVGGSIFTAIVNSLYAILLL